MVYQSSITAFSVLVQQRVSCCRSLSAVVVGIHCIDKFVLFVPQFVLTFIQLHRLYKMLYRNLHATRDRGRPKTRWLDDVSMDLRKMGINEWRDRARDQEAWRRIVMEAKAHPGL
jgi:hypothetical protein